MIDIKCNFNIRGFQSVEHILIFHEKYLEVQARGRATLDGFIAYTKEALDDPRWIPGSNVFVDLSDLTGHDFENFSFLETKTYGDFIFQNAERIGNAKTAILPGKNLDSKILADLYHSLIKFYKIKIDYKIVATREMAHSWFMKN